MKSDKPVLPPHVSAISTDPATTETVEISSTSNVISAQFRQPELETSALDDDGRGSGRLRVVQSSASKSSQMAKSQPNPESSSLKLIVIGSRRAVINNIKTLHHLNYANAGDWSRFQQGPNPGEVMSVVTIRTAHSS